MKLMMVAGEASGDAHGAGLIRNLLLHHPESDIFGIGGLKMLQEGFRPYYMLDALQVHGLVEVIQHLPRLYKTLWRMRDALQEERPDALILIDYPGFNLKLAAYAKALNIPVIFFNSPQIWAWRKGRLQTIRQVVDKMIVLLPFEEPIYQEAQVDVTWVGHPLLDQIQANQNPSLLREQFQLQSNLPVLTIAPGSRPSEIEKHLPTFLETLEVIKKEIGEFQCLFPVAETLNFERIQQQVESSSVPVRLLKGEFLNAIHACDAAIVASGTATLQTGLALKPFVIVYQVSPVTYWIAQKLALTRFIGLVNVLAEKEIVPELLQNDFTAEKVSEKIVQLLKDQTVRDTMTQNLESIRTQLGEPGAYVKAATCISQYLQK